MTTKLELYLDLIRWNRPAGWLLLLWPSLAALGVCVGGLPGSALPAMFPRGPKLHGGGGWGVISRRRRLTGWQVHGRGRAEAEAWGVRSRSGRLVI